MWAAEVTASQVATQTDILATEQPEEAMNATIDWSNEDYAIADLNLDPVDTGCFGDWATWSAGTWYNEEFTEGELYPTVYE